MFAGSWLERPETEDAGTDAGCSDRTHAGEHLRGFMHTSIVGQLFAERLTPLRSSPRTHDVASVAPVKTKLNSPATCCRR